MKKYHILIDPEFRALIPPLSADERAQLKENIRQHGLRDQMIVWYQPDETYTLIDGHHRSEILRELYPKDPELGYFTPDPRIQNREENLTELYQFIVLPNREAVKLWILEHQVGRRNLTEDQRIEMVARIVLLRQEQTAKTSKANLKQGNKAPDVGKTPTSGKKTVPAAAKEFDVPEKPLQAAVNAAKGKPAAPKKKQEPVSSPVAPATTLSETFYVIRRKSDGYFYSGELDPRHAGYFYANIYQATQFSEDDYDEAINEVDQLRYNTPSFDDRKRPKLLRNEWEWVKTKPTTRSANCLTP